MVMDIWEAKHGIAAGHAVVVDMEGSTLAHLAKVNLLSMKKFLYYIQVKFIAFTCWKMHRFEEHHVNVSVLSLNV